MEGEPKMERIELLAMACRIIKDMDEKKAVSESVLMDIVKAAYDIGRKEGMKNDAK